MPGKKSQSHRRYTLAFKRQAVRLSNHPNVSAQDIAESLGIHPVMLYRWRMEARNGTLAGKTAMKKAPPTKQTSADPTANAEAELAQAKKRIKELEKALAFQQEEVEILKKAKRFFDKHRQ